MTYREKFIKEQAEYDLKELSLTHSFALKMASLICLSVVGIVCILGFFFGEKTPLTIGFVVGIAGLLGILSFKFTHSSLL